MKTVFYHPATFTVYIQWPKVDLVACLDSEYEYQDYWHLKWKLELANL